VLEEGVSTLVVAAYPPELERLATRPGVVARAIGVGLVAAATGIERAIAEERPTRLLVVGTAGALPGSGLAIGAIVVATRATLVVRPDEYVPAILQTVAEADAALAGECATRLGAPAVTVASGIGITSSDAEAARLGATAQVEHLETFAVLAAARGRVPATAVLAIANTVGNRAQAEWRQHRVAAEAAALDALARLL
jgi:nucleoside phosphorylase